MSNMPTDFDILEQMGFLALDLEKRKETYSDVEVAKITTCFKQLPEIIDDLENWVYSKYKGPRLARVFQETQEILWNIAEEFANRSELMFKGASICMAALLIDRNGGNERGERIFDGFMKDAEGALSSIDDESLRCGYRGAFTKRMIDAVAYLPLKASASHPMKGRTASYLVEIGRVSIDAYKMMVDVAVAQHKGKKSFAGLAPIIIESYGKLSQHYSAEIVKTMGPHHLSDRWLLLEKVVPLHATIIAHFGENKELTEVASRSFRRHAQLMNEVGPDAATQFLWDLCVGYLSVPVNKIGSQEGVRMLGRLAKARFSNPAPDLPDRLKRKGLIGVPASHESRMLH